MRPITALAVVLVVALPWYFAVGLQTDGQWVRGFLLDHNLGRAAQSLEGHGGSILYYPLALLVGFFPWSVFAVPTVFEIMRRLRLRVGAHGGTVFALCWIGVYMGIFSIARTKLPSYITPCYPAVAMLVASFVVSWLRGAVLSESYWPHAAFGVLASVGAVITVAVPFAATRYLPGEQWLAGIGLIPLLTAAAALWFLRQQARRRAAVTFAVGAVLFTTSLFTLGAARVDHHQTFDQLITVMRAHCDNPRIGVLGAAEPSWVFYTGAPIDKLFAPQLIPNVPEQRILLGTPRTRDWQEKPFWNIWHYLQQEPNRFAITTARHLGQIGELPDDVTVLARTSYFMRDEELVLLASPETIRRTAARPVRTGRRR